MASIGLVWLEAVRTSSTHYPIFIQTFAELCQRQPVPGFEVEVSQDALPLPLPDIDSEEEFRVMHQSREAKCRDERRYKEVSRRFSEEVWMFLTVGALNYLFAGPTSLQGKGHGAEISEAPRRAWNSIRQRVSRFVGDGHARREA